ncbi:hypothetical protein Bphyt_6078 [Paraburkholderia phytofirmans PsJN]|uniref:Uncharacterized protein n=1 Tax=Paraburkholderia phytofirmans (strain DSM 17436 / LMG 22146 / PsJN) TaxID=398527 RepID=B2TAR0_PARPJ|nr:hypothetical protein Bphyt_6078 [Paraburkholderia phytofirmans PsJN]
MNGVGRVLAGAAVYFFDRWPQASAVGLRCMSLAFGLPLFSSVCFFGLRFVLASIGLTS